MDRMRGFARARWTGMVLSLGLATAAGAQVRTNIGVQPPDHLPEWLVLDLSGASREQTNRYQNANSDRRELERELRKLRYTYFRATNQTELRQVGLSQLRGYTDPDAFPLLIEIFRKDDPEIRDTILDMIADRRTPESDVTLAWAAIHERDAEYRAEALRRLSDRVEELGQTPDGVTYVVASRLLAPKTMDELRAASGVAQNLGIIQVIPHLINAQVGGSGGGSGQTRGDLAWILVGRQVAFVSDLQPVVADSAVAFDPTLSVITEGTLLRVGSASVITYHSEVHNALLTLANPLVGRDLSDLGWDQPRWWDWYRTEGQQSIERALATMNPTESAPEADAAATDDAMDSPAGG
ncbi:MAG: HEAT repeat domain-containing protein [Phycisphaeraceae bacterium]|nr:HEAT repeat domain-containing protein [Phycisphaeraceae bacterium]